MDKHATAATIFAAVLGLGGLAIITALTLASEQPYRSALLLCGIIACAFSAGVLLCLFFIAPNGAVAAPELLKQQRLARKEARNAVTSAQPLSPPLRSLTEAEKSTITRITIGYVQTNDAPSQITIMQDSGAGRAARKCWEDFVEAFERGRWDVSQGGGTGHPCYPPTGIGVAFYNYGELAPDQRCVKEALEAAGIPYDIVPADVFMLARTTIYVTEPD